MIKTISDRQSILILSASLAVLGILTTPKNAQALTFTLDNNAPTFNGSTYKYNFSVNLNNNEFLNADLPSGTFADTLDIIYSSNLTGLAPITTVSNPYIIDPGVSPLSASFLVNNTTNGPITLSSVISLEFTEFISSFDYSATSSGLGGGSFNGTINSDQAIPFEFAPGWGLLLLGIGFGGNKLWKLWRDH